MSMSCEEYVVQRLEKLDKELELEGQAHRDDVAGLNAALRDARNTITRLEAYLSMIRDDLKVDKAGTDSKCISFRESIWDKYDAEKFQWYVDVLELDVTEESNE